MPSDRQARLCPASLCFQSFTWCCLTFRKSLTNSGGRKCREVKKEERWVDRQNVRHKEGKGRESQPPSVVRSTGPGVKPAAVDYQLGTRDPLLHLSQLFDKGTDDISLTRCQDGYMRWNIQRACSVVGACLPRACLCARHSLAIQRQLETMCART